MGKGQVSSEALVAGVILVLFMVGVLIGNSLMAREVVFISEDASQSNDCSRLVSAIALVSTVPENAQIETTITSDAIISKNTISFANTFCHFSGAQISKNLGAGNVRISKVSGVISLENF